ncbi:hypothetical protein [Streptomyces sp. enrichment culture]|uniref:hypothetical protein n=1 Tax=Streptomyces sp. enrichment culture TaxID=1795815 RepID=UPI003F5777CE
MRAGWAARTVRAAVFAAVCVLLAALGHTLMSGAAVPGWALTAGAAVSGGAAWWLAGRERGPVLVGAVTVVAQAALHAGFSLAQALTGPPRAGGDTLLGRWLDHLLCAAAAGPAGHHLPAPGPAGASAHAGHAAHAGHRGHDPGAEHLDALASVPGPVLDHGAAGLSPSGMLAAHLLAALLCGLWLAHGERAAFRLVRAVAGLLLTPLRPPPRLPAPPERPRGPRRTTGADRVPRLLLLTHAITSRGPPARLAVA